MQRAVADLSAACMPMGSPTPPLARPRPVGRWTGAAGRGATTPAAPPGTLPADYPFVRVEGDGVHEIAVGPVHAGIIEPGHFRFSVVGEKVLRLEQHLGYKHKGIERRFTELPPLQAHRLAGRVSGDSTVAYAWAYCMALESACGTRCPTRGMAARADAGTRTRGQPPGRPGRAGQRRRFGLRPGAVLAAARRLAAPVGRAFGHRFMMDAVCPAAWPADLSAHQRDACASSATRRARSAPLRHIYDEHAGLQDRFMTTGRVTPELAARLGLTGMAGRASGQAVDLRCNHALAALPQLRAAIATQQGGDVAARVAVRFDEVLESLRLIRELCTGLPVANAAAPSNCCPRHPRPGWVEGWRGEVLVALTGGRRRPHRTLPLPRPVVAELARAGACGDRQHRSGLPAHQQVLQPQLFGARPLMWH
jgi:hypothetical protein